MQRLEFQQPSRNPRTRPRARLCLVFLPRPAAREFTYDGPAAARWCWAVGHVHPKSATMQPELKHLDYAGERLRLVGSRVARPGQAGGGHHGGSDAGHSDEKSLLAHGPSVSAPIFIRASNPSPLGTPRAETHRSLTRSRAMPRRTLRWVAGPWPRWTGRLTGTAAVLRLVVRGEPERLCGREFGPPRVVLSRGTDLAPSLQVHSISSEQKLVTFIGFYT